VKALLIFDFHVDRIIHQSFILNCEWQLFDLIFTMDLGLFLSILQEFRFFLCIIISAGNWVKVVSVPVFLGSLCLLNLLVSSHLRIMVLQILIGDNIVVLEPLVHVGLLFRLFLIGLWPLLWLVEVVVLQVHV